MGEVFIMIAYSAAAISISNQELMLALAALSRKEREATHEFLLHLIEFDNRKLYREQGYSSLFDYLTRKLGYSEGSAQRRILGARCMREHPELGALFLVGKVTLCSIATAAGSIKREKTEIKEIVGKSKREVEALVAAKEPERKAPREVVRPVAVARTVLPLFQAKPVAVSEADALPAAAAELTLPKSSGQSAEEGRPVEERYEIRFSLSKEEYQALEEAKNLLSNSLGSTVSVAAVLNKLVERFLKPYRRRGELRPSYGRYIPASVRREVYRRDGGECAYVASDGTKCKEKRHLEYDHVHPYALGGKTEAANLRLMCGAHNRLWSEGYFGKYEVKERAVEYGA